jgi:membrane protein implicated in regulation of membrane protease activity
MRYIILTNRLFFYTLCNILVAIHIGFAFLSNYFFNFIKVPLLLVLVALTSVMLMLFIPIGYLVIFNKKLKNIINRYILWVYKVISSIISALYIKKYISTPKFITMGELNKIEKRIKACKK